MIGQGYNKTKEFVRTADLFCTTDLLRYRDNPEYRSLTGGLCSIAVFIAFVALFAGTILNTFNKNVIIASTTYREETTPSHFQTSSNPFLFALGINGIDLNDPTTKYFNLVISQRIKVKNGDSSRQYHELVACDRSVWTSVDEKLGETFDRLDLSKWLCLPEGIKMEFEGKYSSNIFKYIKISVQNCTVEAGQNRTCVDYSNLQGQTYSFNYYFLNSIINPDNSKYLDSYLQDRNYFSFNTRFGVTANIFISTFSIQTDQSLWPLPGRKNEEGGIVYEPAQQFMTEGEQFVQLYLRKSSLSLDVTRSFKKYDDTVSYLGGLFSSTMVVLWLMFKYNQSAYQVDIAGQIFKYDHGQPIRSNSFNLISYLGHAIYSGVQMIRDAPKWPKIKHFDEVREQISKQLDIKLILKQLSFLEECMTYLFEDYQLNCLHLKGKSTLKEARKNRQRFGVRGKFLRWKQMQESKLKAEDKVIESIDDPMRGQQSANSMKITHRRVTFRRDSNLHSSQNSSQMRSVQRSAGPQNWGITSKWEIDSDLSEEGEQGGKKLYEEMMKSLMRLKAEAERGNHRCSKIFGNLDEKVIPNGVQLTESEKSQFEEIRVRAREDEARREWDKMKIVANQFDIEGIEDQT